MDNQDNQALLRHAAMRASTNTFFVAFVLVHYQHVHQLSDPELASWLELMPENLPLLRLCRRPTTHQEIQQVADYVKCNAERLAVVFQL